MERHPRYAAAAVWLIVIDHITSMCLLVPPQSSYQEAHKHFALAEENRKLLPVVWLEDPSFLISHSQPLGGPEPGFYVINTMRLAQTCFQLKKKEEGIAWLRRAKAAEVGRNPYYSLMKIALTFPSFQQRGGDVSDEEYAELLKLCKKHKV